MAVVNILALCDAIGTLPYLMHTATPWKESFNSVGKQFHQSPQIIEHRKENQDVGNPVPGFGQPQNRNLLPINILGY